MRKSIIAAILCAVAIGCPIVASAQSSDLRLVTSPLPINLTAKPGTDATTQIRIKNDGQSAETLKVTLMKFGAYGETGSPRISDPEPADEFISWVSFPERQFSIGPGEWKSVPMKITLPESAAFGYYYAVVFSRADDTPEVQSGQTAISGGTAVLALLDADVPGAKRETRVASYLADHSVYEFLPATFTVRLENTGNIHLSPRGNVFVGRVGEQDTEILEINQEKGNILPGSFREYSTSWTDGFPAYKDKLVDGKVVRDEKGNIVRELSWDLGNIAKFRFGKYQAKMLMVYDDGHRDIPLEGTVEFWVIPWRILLAGIVMIILILIGLRSTVVGLLKNTSKRNK
ncbi:MAG: hypothetical protein HGA31_01520 [Candidatus Moranbacteria bacterium]|nr:hypothetical protein [Candidatus Moranbacteria bacterium]